MLETKLWPAQGARPLPFDDEAFLASLASKVLYFSVYNMSRDPSCLTRCPVGIEVCICLRKVSSENVEGCTSPDRGLTQKGEKVPSLWQLCMVSGSLVNLTRENLAL